MCFFPFLGGLCRAEEFKPQLDSPRFRPSAEIFLSPRLAPDVAQIANTFILRRNIGELLKLGARKIVVFEWNEVHSSPRLKHQNVFYHVREGVFLKPFKALKTRHYFRLFE